ncbi:MAG: hypothetical protein DYG94_02610 [Leptolyngbya sp. PLA3]|nr:MAG: hypothetical protein EDM82_01945 [Cyanobacteria bacterium CYA]MCE7967619.1 hypothetical protein [Leptolyngbya sp. PL-A3]
MRTKHLTCLVALSWVLTPVAPAQDKPEPTPQQQPDQPETLRDRLRLRIEHARESLDRLEKLLARVEAGEEIDPAELIEAMPDRPVRERFGEREPGERRFGPGGPGVPGGEMAPGVVGRGPGGFPGMGHGESGPVPTAEEITVFVQNQMPWLHERLTRADSEQAGMGQETLRRVAPMIVEIMQVQRDDPELGQLKMEQFRLGADWIETSGKVREALHSGAMTREQAVAAFTELAERHFELRQQIARHEIKRLRADLEAREQGLNKDESERSQWVSRMAERMVERMSGRWGRGPRSSDSDREDPKDERNDGKPW